MRHRLAAILGPLVLLAIALQAVASPPTRDAIRHEIQEGNWADAYEAIRARFDSKEIMPDDVSDGVTCLTRLGRLEELDPFLQRAEGLASGDARLLGRIARAYLEIPKQGYQIAGQWRRGQQRGGGEVFNHDAHDRVRAITIAKGAAEVAGEDEGLAAEMWAIVAEALTRDRLGSQSWRLQSKTDLEELPEPEKGWRTGAPASPPPVTSEGEPLLHSVPQDWVSAESDGQRWRWALAQRARAGGGHAESAELSYAEFLYQQFGVQTLRSQLGSAGLGDDPRETLRQLSDDESIARLANGTKRFKLPEEHQYLAMYERHKRWRRVAEIRLNRHQRARAADAFRSALKQERSKRISEQLTQQLDQITKPWVRINQVRTQVADEGATIRISHRNTNLVDFSARAIDHIRLIDDVKRMLKDNPEEVDRRELEVERLAWRLIHSDGEKYVGEETAKWELEVENTPDHADGHASAATPLQQAGAYLVTATVEGGNTTEVIVWVADTVVVEKPTADGNLYAVLDARSGRPVKGAQLELFGYRQPQPKELPNGTMQRMPLETQRLSQLASDDGLVSLDLATEPGQPAWQWLATAEGEPDRFAFLGFRSVWRNPREEPDPAGRQASTYLVTDRPVYRPGSLVNFKAWVGRADYCVGVDELTTGFAHQEFQIEVYDPRGEKIDQQSLTASAYGGIEGEIEIGESAALGRYRISIAGFGDGAFRVEEYRKPEFEVTVESPAEPIRLGDAFEATIKADYYFGSPVAGGEVSYRVTRQRRSDRWLPIEPWDWLYGRGYGLLASSARWHPTWGDWGCVPPPWIPRPQAPPEVVLEGRAELDTNGKLVLKIDTDQAKQSWPEDDHEYTISADVTDTSRRVIRGAGSVLAARRPLEVVVTLDRGHYEVGDTVSATTHVRSPDGKPIAGQGTMRLWKLARAAGEDPETEESNREIEVQTWELETSADGQALHRIKASEPGRYRLAYESLAVEGARVEGGVVFTILGPGFDGSGFEFESLEVTPEKSEFQPGDVARLLVSTDRVGSVVYLFVRPQSGAYGEPSVVRLDGQCETIELPIAEADQPNLFVEAVTVSDGKVHSVVKQLVVPPAPRVLQVEAAPSADAYLPGQEGTIRVRLTDTAGEPVVGEATVAVYDKSVEAIAPDMLPTDIRKRFWGWKRRHNASTRHSLWRTESGFARPGQASMQNLGSLGALGAPSIPAVGFLNSNFAGGVARGARLGVAMQPAAFPVRALTEASDTAAVTKESAGESDGVTVRSNFADTALWIGSVVTDEQGFAELPVTLPESLTAWKVRVWAMGAGVRVGQGEAEVVTRKDLMVRLLAPRFLVETDEAVLSALVHNELPVAQNVEVTLQLDGDAIKGPESLLRTVRIEPNGKERIDWRVKAEREGVAGLTATAVATPVEQPVEGAEGQTASLSDGMRIDLPVLVHGAERVESFNAVIRPDERLATFELVIPEERRPEATKLEVRYSPSLVGAMLRALPYLVEYPHGCTEQTLNRFLPAVIVRKTLADLGVDLEALPEGGAAQQAINESPIRDAEELGRIVAIGVRRLDEMQLSDGGWGWFSGLGERSSPHTTAVVVRGLILASQSGVAVPRDMTERGISWLQAWRDEQLRRLANVDEEGEPIDHDLPWKRHADNTDALVHLVLAESGRFNAQMRERLIEDRLKLAPYCLATLSLALHLESEQARADEQESLVASRDRVMRNLTQFVVEDNENQTAYLDLPGPSWWWYGSEFEAHAYLLKLLCETEPEVASRIVKHLVNNRRNATRWNSTRDTALVIEALAAYATASGELGAPDAGAEPTRVEVWIDGQRRQETEILAGERLLFEGRFDLVGEALAAGRHTLELRKHGAGRLYTAAALTNFSLEKDLRAAGLEVRVERRVWRLEPTDAQASDVDQRGGVVDLQVEGYRRLELVNLAEVESGELIEVELILRSKNDYEYLLIEDPKPAGFEPIDTRSGYRNLGLHAYTEFRDQKVGFYLSTLARGEHTLRYRMRAETPGVYAALPTQISAMYAPELRGNSDEIRLEVVE